MTEPTLGPGLGPTIGSGIPITGAAPERTAPSMPGAVPQSLANQDASVVNAFERLPASGARPREKPDDEALMQLCENLRLLEKRTPGWFDRFEAWITGSAMVYGEKMDSAQLKATMDAYPQAKQRLYDGFAAKYAKYENVSSTKEAIKKDISDAQIPEKKVLCKANELLSRMTFMRSYLQSTGEKIVKGYHFYDERMLKDMVNELRDAIKKGEPVSRTTLECVASYVRQVESDFLNHCPPSAIRAAVSMLKKTNDFLKRGFGSEPVVEGLPEHIKNMHNQINAVLEKLNNSQQEITKTDLLVLDDALEELERFYLIDQT